MCSRAAEGGREGHKAAAENDGGETEKEGRA